MLRGRIQELLEQVDAGSQVVATEPLDIVEDVATPRRDSAVTAWVNAIYGCNERYSYCVVPNTRGAEQSREPDAIRVGAGRWVGRSAWMSQLFFLASACQRAQCNQLQLGTKTHFAPLRRTLRHAARLPHGLPP